MKTNLIMVLAIIGVLIAGGAVYFLTQQNYQPATNNNQNNSPATNPPSSVSAVAQTYNIEISNFVFSPSSLTIKKGDTVIWTNKDLMSHTITSDSGSELESARFGRAETYSHTFNTAGTFSYHCSVHSTMKGTIIVE